MAKSLESDKHSQWKGGFTKQTNGYMYIHKFHIDPAYFPMTEKSGYVLLHRYNLAKGIGRCLDKSELVHHIDGNKANNDISNLELTTRAEHMKFHHPKLVREAQAVHVENKKKELDYLNENGYITAQQAADILGKPHSTIRRRQDRGILSSFPTKLNGQCLPRYELTEHAHLFVERSAPKYEKGAILSE